MRTALATLAVLLILPAAAHGGGFATVELSSLPEGTAPGVPWVVDLRVLAHGRSDAPVPGLRPSVEVVKADGSSRRSFAARPTGRPGVYRARVTFESPGSWRYSVSDGYATTHEYPPVQVGSEPAATTSPPPPRTPEGSSGGSNVLLALLAALVAGLAAGLVARVVGRPSSRGRPAQA